MRKWLAGTLGTLLILVALLWVFRAEALLAFLAFTSASESVAEKRVLDWQEPAATDASRDRIPAPNIVLIVLDDFGINDLSTLAVVSPAGVSPRRVLTASPMRARCSHRPMPAVQPARPQGPCS